MNIEKSSRPDLIFINKHGPLIYDALYTSLQMDSNSPDNIEAVYTTLALLCVELAATETAIDLLQLLLGWVFVFSSQKNIHSLICYDVSIISLCFFMGEGVF